MSILYNKKNLNDEVQVYDGDVTVQWPEGDSAVVFLTEADVTAVTLPTPVSGSDDGKSITFISTTAQAHTVTCATIGFNAGNAAGDVGTFGGAIGDGFTCFAYGGEVYTTNVTNVTFA